MKRAGWMIVVLILMEVATVGFVIVGTMAGK